MNPSSGTYLVFYAQSSEAFLDQEPLPTVADLPLTHTFVRALQATDLGDVYVQMQAHRWSPNGEARFLIEGLGLHHTSLSIGDVVAAPDGKFYLCRSLGWQALAAT